MPPFIKTHRTSLSTVSSVPNSMYPVAMLTQNGTVQDQRGLRFPFNAAAEAILPPSPDRIPARVTELSFRGCFLEISAPLQEHQLLHVKIFESDQFFEASAKVLYLRPGGAGLVFDDVKPHFRSVLQNWILTALDNQPKSRLHS